MLRIEIISATRLSQEEFWKRSALGVSLTRLKPDPRLASHIAYENRRGLPEIYNERIRANAPDAFLVFIHDDVWIDTHFFGDLIHAGCRAFNVIGVAGNRRRAPGQPSWLHSGKAANREFVVDEVGNLSGGIALGNSPAGAVYLYGPSLTPCELLDGVLLAANCGLLQEQNVFFDTRFDFHFYDMDFCRTARNAGLSLGTWPISITHESPGMFGTEAWRQKELAYFAKWGD